MERISTLTMALLVIFTFVVGLVAATDSSSCYLGWRHVTEQVTWKTTACAFCDLHTTKANQTLWINYNGTLTNGTLFDSSYTPANPWPTGDPLNFTLGAGQVIKGFDAGLYQMCPGEQRNLVIPSKYGYGEKGVPGVIPPNATLIFDVELMGIGTIKNTNMAKPVDEGCQMGGQTVPCPNPE